MASQYLKAEFVEHHLSTIPPAAIPENWGLERIGQFYQLDLKMCQISALHFDFEWGSGNNAVPKMASVLDAPMRILRLDVSLNDLSFLHHEWLLPFRNLRALDASLNQIKHCRGLKVLTHLRTLNLSHNALHNIDDLVPSQTLVELRLSVNDIRDIVRLPSMVNLKILDLSNNKIQSLDGLSSLPRLEELYAHRNQLKDILAVMSCSQLRVLDAANNSISSFDVSIKVLQSLPCLQAISLHGNPIDREPYYQGEILRACNKLMTLDNISVKPLPKREEDHRRHADNLFSLKDAARYAFEDRMRVAKERLDENVHFLQRRIVALQHEHEDFVSKLKADLEACLRYLDTLTDEELQSHDRSNIGAILSRNPYHRSRDDDVEGRDGAMGRGPPTDYSKVRETDELLRCAYNELVKQSSSPR